MIGVALDEAKDAAGQCRVACPKCKAGQMTPCAYPDFWFRDCAQQAERRGVGGFDMTDKELADYLEKQEYIDVMGSEQQFRQIIAALRRYEGQVSTTPGGLKSRKQPCTCTGACRGADGLGEGWACSLHLPVR